MIDVSIHRTREQFRAATESLLDLPPAHVCGNCGKSFATKGEKRRHKAGGCSAFNTGPGDRVDDAGLFGRPQDHITPEVKARAAAEWDAMDARGRLPAGWTYKPELQADWEGR